MPSLKDPSRGAWTSFQAMGLRLPLSGARVIAAGNEAALCNDDSSFPI
jgi:hypothetical protein